MKQYIAILRGINVGGKRKILMTDLKKLFSQLGYSNVATYIQSGNIIFETSKENKAQLEQEIGELIKNTYEFVVPVFVKTKQEIEQLFLNNPFLKTGLSDIERLHVTFLQDMQKNETIANMNASDYLPDRFEIFENMVYVFCSKKYSDSKLSNTFFERKCKTIATTRNWKTIKQLYNMLYKQVK